MKRFVDMKTIQRRMNEKDARVARKPKLDPEACPGCGAMPGEGLTPSCKHEGGCGFWRGLMDGVKQ